MLRFQRIYKHEFYNWIREEQVSRFPLPVEIGVEISVPFLSRFQAYSAKDSSYVSSKNSELW